VVRRLRDVLLHGAPATGGPDAMERALCLSRLALLRRLDRVAALERIALSTGVDDLLAPDHAAGALNPARPALQLRLISGAWLEQTGLHTREQLDPAWRSTGAFPVQVSAAHRGGAARFAVAVDALAPVACVRAVIEPAGLDLELWGPAGSSGPAELQHAFDARLLAPGRNTILILLGVLEGGFRPERVLELDFESREAAVRRGLGCAIRSATLHLP
jgi:hypothetical protein